MARGQARLPKDGNPSPLDSMAIEAPDHAASSRDTRGVSSAVPRPRPEGQDHATHMGGAQRRSPGVRRTLSGERRQALGPEPATSPGQCELRRLAPVPRARYAQRFASRAAESCTCTEEVTRLSSDFALASIKK